VERRPPARASRAGFGKTPVVAGGVSPAGRPLAGRTGAAEPAHSQSFFLKSAYNPTESTTTATVDVQNPLGSPLPG
jgi:hypothetical protein